MCDQATQKQSNQHLVPAVPTTELSPNMAATVKHILTRCPDIGSLKLQKILYYVQGYALAWTGKNPFPELPEAWKKGPVYTAVRGDARNGFTQANKADVSELPKNTVAITDAVLNRFRNHTGQQLADRTHNESPWVKARKGIPADRPSRASISRQDMLEFFLRDESQQLLQQPVLVDEWQIPSEDFLASERQRWAKTLEILGR